MTKQDKKTLGYLLIYVAVILIRFIYIYKIIGINPIRCKNSCVDIYSMEHQVFFYIAIFFAATVLYAIINKTCIFELYICYTIIVVGLWIITIMCFLTFEADVFYGAVMLIYMHSLKKHLKSTYPMMSLTGNLKKHNFGLVMLLLIAVAIFNIIYIIMPRDTLYIYVNIEPGDSVQYEIKEGIIDEVSFVKYGGQGDEIYLRGWIFEAKEEGIETIYISDKEGGDITLNSEINVTIGEDLKFHNVLTMEYVILFYPLNVLIICYCVMYIILVVISKVEDIISKKQNSKADVTI